MEKKIELKSKKNRLGIRGWIYAGKYGIERYAYILHRITGLALILYLILHIFVTGKRIEGTDAWKSTMGLLHNPLFKFFEFLLLVAFIFHAINGFRLILIEFGFFIGKPAPPKYPYISSIHKQRPLFYILMIFAGIFIFISILKFNFFPAHI